MIMNWSHDLNLVPSERSFTADSIESLQQVLAEAPTRVRVLGSRFTYPENLDVANVHVTGLLLGGELANVQVLGPGTVRVGGGATLDAVWEALAERGLELPVCPPVITDQTIGGALATGTHSQGVGDSGLDSCLTAVEFVDGSGTLHRFGRDDDEFAYAALNLGLLGAVTAAEFQVRPHVAMRRVSQTGDLADDVHRCLDPFATATHSKAWWFPYEDVVHLWMSSPAGRQDAPNVFVADNQQLRATVGNVRQRMDSQLGSPTGQVHAIDTLDKFERPGPRRGTALKIWRNGIPVPQLNMELAVPIDRYHDAVRTVRRILLDAENQLHYPVILRPSGPSMSLLSPAFETGVIYFGFVSYMTSDGVVQPQDRAVLNQVEAELLPMGARPHWGKYFSPSLVKPQIAARANKFGHAVRRFDPDSVFRNDHYYRALGLAA